MTNPIPIEVIRLFCSRDPARHQLLAPENRGDYCYASDSAVCIRVARHPDATETKWPDQKRVNFEAVLGDLSDGHFQPLPVEPPEGW